MSWENYNPITDNSQFEFDDEIAVRVGDGLTVYDDNDSKTAYLVVNISETDDEATLYNYMSKEFETVSREQVLSWRRDGAEHSPFAASHELTLQKETGSTEIVGVKIHGNGIQFQETLEMHGRDVFANCLRIAIRPDTHGREITEPYHPDESVVHPTFSGFVESVKDEFVPMLTEASAMPESAAEELLDNILKGYEVVARSRWGLSEDWYYFESTEDAKEQLESVDTSETTIENEFVVRSSDHGAGDIVIFH